MEMPKAKQRRRTRSATLSRQMRPILLEMQGGRCAICGVSLDGCAASETEVDHVLSPKRGGALNDPDNFQLACKECNRMKSDLTMEELTTRAARIAAYQTGRC